MRSCVVLLFASLLTLCEAQGTIVTPVFVLKGRDLLLKLHADPPERVLYVDWKINKTVTLVRFKPSGESHVDPRFTGRVQFPENKFSAMLKNVQEVDSGVYSAEAVTGVDKLLTEYKVTVQGPVSPVELTVDRVDSSSSESCDLHVTCRTHNARISSTFRCSKRVCSQKGGERSEVTTSGASLQIYLLKNVIICNHNNQVHRTHDLIHAEQLCYPSTDPPSHLGWVIAVCVLVVVLVIAGAVIVWLYKERKSRISSTEEYKDIMDAAAQHLQNKFAEENRIREEERRREQEKKKEKKEKRRAAEASAQRLVASAPPYSSVPSAAKSTDP